LSSRVRDKWPFSRRLFGAIIGIVFHQQVTDAGVGTTGWIMLGASVVLLAITFFDRTLRRAAAA
jgi:hypothetical protein